MSNIEVNGDMRKQAQIAIQQIKRSLLSAEPLLKKNIGEGTDDDTQLVNSIYPEIEKKYKKIIPQYSSWLTQKYKLLNRITNVFVQGYKVWSFTKRKRLILFVCKRVWDEYYEQLSKVEQSSLLEKRRDNKIKLWIPVIAIVVTLLVGFLQTVYSKEAINSFGHTPQPILPSTSLPSTSPPLTTPTLTTPPLITPPLITPAPLLTHPPLTPTPNPTPAILQSEYNIKNSEAVKLNYSTKRKFKDNDIDIFLGLQPNGNEEKLKSIDDLYKFTNKVAYYESSFQMNTSRECGKSWYQIRVYQNEKDPYNGNLFWIDGEFIYKPALQWLICQSKSSCEITIASNTIRKSTISSGYADSSKGHLLPLVDTPKSVYTDLVISGRKYRFDPRYQDATQKYIFFFIGGVGEDFDKLKRDMMFENQDVVGLIFYGGIINGEFKGYIYTVSENIEPDADQRIIPENDKEKFKVIGEIAFSVVDT